MKQLDELSKLISHGSTLKVAIVTNIPAPYRVPVYEQLSSCPSVDLKLFFCSGREPDREWDVSHGTFKSQFLRERFIRLEGRFIHVNPDVLSALNKFRPDVVVTTGFNPTHLVAFAYAMVLGKPHICMTDGTKASESAYSLLHRLVRRIVFSFSSAFVGASEGAFDLYREYGIAEQLMFKSHLCANNELFFQLPPCEKRYDFIFCGRFVRVKNPTFALDVAASVARRIGRRVSILFVGSGELEVEIRRHAGEMSTYVEAVFAGFARQADLPSLYGAARLFLFPTSWDPWGVVANEACAAGIPTIVGPAAGSAGELIVDGQNGFIRPLDIVTWCDAIVPLLCNHDTYTSFSRCARLVVSKYSYQNAAAGLAAAIAMASERVGSAPSDDLVPMPRKPRVLILQRRLTHYRTPLFEAMRSQLAKLGIELAVAYGDGTRDERSKADYGVLDWGVHVPCRYFLGGRICWQNASALLGDVDLVITTQENKLFFNYWIMLFRRHVRLAFWGHGRNFQTPSVNSLRERIKRWVSTRVVWWFAYTESSAEVVRLAGFNTRKITVLNNSVDTREMVMLREEMTSEDLERIRSECSLGAGPLGIMVGSLYSEKRLDFLLEAAALIRQNVPGFQLLLVGDGPQRSIAIDAQNSSGGVIRWLGARHGREKVGLITLSQVFLNPGLVGLGILDSFVCGVPMVTTSDGLHSPEISYLEDGINGVMVSGDVRAYASAVVALLADPGRLAHLREGCFRSAENVSLEDMASRFCVGIDDCLRHLGTHSEHAAERTYG